MVIFNTYFSIFHNLPYNKKVGFMVVYITRTCFCDVSNDIFAAEKELDVSFIGMFS